MKKLSVALLGALMISGALATPALALGGCGPNAHQYRGHCVYGGQNQNWCLRQTGHVARRAPDGTMRCYR